MADQIDGNQICILLFCTKKGVKTCDLTGSSCKQHLFSLFQPCFCSLIASSDIRLHIFGRLDLPQIFLLFNLSMFCFPFICISTAKDTAFCLDHFTCSHICHPRRRRTAAMLCIFIPHAIHFRLSLFFSSEKNRAMPETFSTTDALFFFHFRIQKSFLIRLKYNAPGRADLLTASASHTFPACYHDIFAITLLHHVLSFPLNMNMSAAFPFLSFP